MTRPFFQSFGNNSVFLGILDYILPPPTLEHKFCNAFQIPYAFIVITCVRARVVEVSRGKLRVLDLVYTDVKKKTSE